MVNVPSLRHHVVKGPPARVNQMGDRPDHGKGREEREGSEEHALVTRGAEMLGVETGHRPRRWAHCRSRAAMIERRDDAGHRGEADCAKHKRDEESTPTPHGAMVATV